MTLTMLHNDNHAQNLCLPPISKQVPLHEIIDRTLTSQNFQLSMKNISEIDL